MVSSDLRSTQPLGKIAAMDHELVDAKIAASEARTDAKFSELRGEMRVGFEQLSAKMDLLAAQLGHSASEIGAVKSTLATEIGTVKAGMSELKMEVRTAEDRNRSENLATRSTVIVTATASFLALGGLMIGLLAYGGDQFGRGVDIGSRIKAEVQDQVKSAAPQIDRAPAPSTISPQALPSPDQNPK